MGTGTGAGQIREVPTCWQKHASAGSVMVEIASTRAAKLKSVFMVRSLKPRGHLAPGEHGTRTHGVLF